MDFRFLIQVLLANFLHCITGVPYSHQLFFSEECYPPNLLCYDGICIPSEWICDGNEDCLHGEDEYCIKQQDPPEMSEDRQFRKRSPNVEINELFQSEDEALRKDAMALIFNAKKVLDTGVNHIPDPMENEKKLFKRNQNEIDAETRIETENPLETSESDPTSTEQISILSTDASSSTSMISSSTASEEGTSSTSINSMTTTLTSSTLDDFITLFDTEITQTSEDPTTVSTDMPPDILEEKLMILKEIIAHYISLKQWIEKVLNKTETTTTNCPTYLPTPITTESSITESSTSDSITTESTTTITNSTDSTESTTITKKPNNISKVTCPYHFQFMSGICIFVQIYPPVSWIEANALCNAQRSTLIQINSKEFFEKLLKQLNFDKMRVYDFWIGATNHNTNKQWSWTDGSPITNFDVWGFNLNTKNIDLLIGYNKPHQCGFLDGKLYSYVNEASCYEPKGFICQFKSKFQEVYYYSSNDE